MGSCLGIGIEGQATLSLFYKSLILNREFSSHQIAGAPEPFSFSYSYDLAGSLKVETYPSGRAVNTHYTTGTLISALTGTKGGVLKNYLTGLGYSPFGALRQVTLGNNLIERTDYLNGLPRVRQIRLGDSGNATLRGEWQFRYCNYGASPYFRADSCSANNGNVLGQIHTISGASFNQTYQHDNVNRLCSVNETGSTAPLNPRNCGDLSGLSGEAWYQAFQYDRYGNLATPTDPGVTVDPLTVRNLTDYDTATNRLKTLSGTWNYDTAGNVTTYGGWTLAYDAANRMKSSQPSGGSLTSYVYDADGRRVKKTKGAESTYFVYDAFGQLAAEYSSTAPTGAPETHYLTTDHLGSTRLVTNQTGAVISRHDYLPYGWELYSGLNGRTTGQGYLTTPETVSTPSQRFTGKERDAETGLDYFGARYFSGAQGRFTSPDLPLVDQRPGDPQSWNLYGYVRNNPLKYHDPDGRICVFGIGNTCNQDVPPPPPPPAPRPPVLSPNGTPAQGPQPAPAPGPFTLTVNNRQAQIPGGSALAAVGVNHQWITTSTGASAGLGTQQGVPQSDAPGVETYVVDHTGQVPDSSTTYTNVDQGAAMSYLQPGKRVGNWIPAVSDCNTWVCNVVRNSTPHDIVTYEYTPYLGYRSSVQKNVVVYSDGSVRKPGAKR